MFKEKDTVVYSTSGVCEITAIKEMEFRGKQVKYYVLQPLNSSGSTVFVPVDNPKLTAKMKQVLSKDEINSMLNDKTQYLTWVEERKERAEKYAAVISEGNKRELLCMLHMLYKAKLEAESCGKKQYTTDKRLMDLAEKIVGDEFSYVMEMPSKGVAQFVYEKMEG